MLKEKPDRQELCKKYGVPYSLFVKKPQKRTLAKWDALKAKHPETVTFSMNELDKALKDYTNPKSPLYDAEFAATVKDWK